MTKEEVRALVISKLRIAANHTVWDVGAGTGSVSVEAALAVSRGTVCAIERNADPIDLMRKKREEFGLTNRVVVEGEAPAALVDLPAPDRVFIGGSAGNLDAIIETALNANPRALFLLTF